MILGFSTVFPKEKGSLSGKKTRFPERVIRSLPIDEYKKLTQFDFLCEQQKEDDWLEVTEFQNLTPKPHTIREDAKNRWKVGMDIHFYTGVRTKNMYQFAPVLIVKSIQHIEIKWHHGLGATGIESGVSVKINGKALREDKIKTLAINGGFNTVKDFLEWFNEDFEGKLICWVDDLKY